MEANSTPKALALTLANIGEALFVTDADGKLTFMNRLAEALTGWERDKAVGRSVLEIVRIVEEKTQIGRAHV